MRAAKTDNSSAVVDRPAPTLQEQLDSAVSELRLLEIQDAQHADLVAAKNRDLEDLAVRASNGDDDALTRARAVRSHVEDIQLAARGISARLVTVRGRVEELVAARNSELDRDRWEAELKAIRGKEEEFLQAIEQWHTASSSVLEAAKRVDSLANELRGPAFSGRVDWPRLSAAHREAFTHLRTVHGDQRAFNAAQYLFTAAAF